LVGLWTSPAVAAPPDDAAAPAEPEPEGPKTDPEHEPEPAPGPSSDELPDPKVSAPFNMPAADRLDPYGPRPPGVAKLNREQIVRYALENPAVQMADADIEVMESYLLQAKFAWVPIIKTSAFLSPGANVVCDDVTLARDPSDAGFDDEQTFDFQYCRAGTNEDLDLNTVSGYFAQLNRAGIALEMRGEMLIPLTTFGKIWQAKKAAQIGVSIAKLKRQATRQEIVLKVYEAHAALLLSRESITILDEAWDVIEDERKKILRDLGGTGFDVDPDDINPDRDPDDLVELEVGEIEVATLMREARKVESVALAALWALCGRAAPPGFDVAETQLIPDEVKGGIKNIGDYREMAVRNRPEAKMAGAAVQLRRRQEKFARANFLPDLGIAITGRYGYGNAFEQRIPSLYYARRLNFSSLYFGLALKWDLDFHNDAFALKRARAQRRKAESQREVAELLLQLEVEQAFRDLTDARGDADFMELARDKSWALVVSQQQKQSIGGGKFRDLRRHLKSWAEFQFKHFEAIMAQNAALARLSRAVGTPLASKPPQAGESR
jgi:outer membrane protein TolC